MKKLLFLIAIHIIFNVNGQVVDSSLYLNSAGRLLKNNKGFTIGGYGQIDYNQPVLSEYINSGTLDVHRLVLLFGYNFNNKLKFVSEVEYEHVKEVYVEQAFVQYKINNYINARGGLILIPVGIINEYHEPPAFNGVERPYTDKYIIPTTWREIGAGFTGNIIEASLKYQLYVVNGFNGYDGESKFDGKNGLRKGRQKGAESYITSPNFSGKIEFYGIRGLNLGISGYFGNSQSVAYENIQKVDKIAIASADSTVVGISMWCADLRYRYKGFAAKAQYIIAGLSNTDKYNQKLSTDVGSIMQGYYAGIEYDVFNGFDRFNSQLILFFRYERYNTHFKVSDFIIKNKNYDNIIYTTGIEWKPSPKVVVKADFQTFNIKTDNDVKLFNAGIGFMF